MNLNLPIDPDDDDRLDDLPKPVIIALIIVSSLIGIGLAILFNNMK